MFSHTWRSCARYGDGEVIDVNVNTEARDKNRFRRLRDELWWEVREEFEAGIISIPDDPILIEELAAFHYEEDNNGLIKVESRGSRETRFRQPEPRGHDHDEAILYAARSAAHEARRTIAAKNPRRRRLEDSMKMEHLEALALQLVRMRRTVNGLLTTLSALSPAIEIAIQQLEPKCRRCLLNHGVLNECRCKGQESSHMKPSGAGERWPR